MNISTYFRKVAEENFEYSLKTIPKKVEAIYQAEYICKLWMFGDLERSYRNSNETKKRPDVPIHIYLKLSPNDDLCQEVMLFLEEVEDYIKDEFVDTYSMLGDVLKSYNNKYITLHFLPHEEGKCRIIQHTAERFEKMRDVRTEIICL